MLAKRIVVCLDVRDGKTTKGVRFRDNRDIGDPVQMARRYYEQGVDELVFYDITASAERRGIFLEVVERVAAAIFVPFAVGGGISSVAQMREVLLDVGEVLTDDLAHGDVLVVDAGYVGRVAAGRGDEHALIDIADRAVIDPDTLRAADRLVELVDEADHGVLFHARPFFPVLDDGAVGRDINRTPRAEGQQSQGRYAQHHDQNKGSHIHERSPGPPQIRNRLPARCLTGSGRITAGQGVSSRREKIATSAWST